MEIEIRKELAEKRRKQGILSPQQKEAMQLELEKEKVVRGIIVFIDYR